MKIFFKTSGLGYSLLCTHVDSEDSDQAGQKCPG